MSTNEPTVSVLMPVRNEAGFIRRSLGAVLAQNYPKEQLQIIVADGMSTDGTRAIIQELAQRHAQLMLIDNSAGIVATGLNGALVHATGQIVVRVDGHCEIATDYVRRCVEHIQADRVEAVGGPVETIGESYVARAIAVAMSSPFGVGDSAFRRPTSKTQFVDTVPFPAYTRSLIDRAGLFDEELVRNQDDEYNYRLRKLGTQVLLASDVRSRYHSRATLHSLARQYFQYGFWKVRVMQKHPRQMQPRQFMPPAFVVALLASLFVSIFVAPARLLLAFGIVAYAIVAAVAGVFATISRKKGWRLVPILPLAFFVIHVSYGCGFLVGLAKFWNRWSSEERELRPQPAIRG